MKRAGCVAALILALAPWIATGMGEVLQPNRTNYTAAELEQLLPAIDRLMELLAGSTLSSLKRHSAPWTSLDFAAYSQGILTDLGYRAEIVKTDLWPDGAHHWLRIEIPLATRTAWVPVEAAPPPGERQIVLGVVPLTVDSTGAAWFEPRYLRPAEVLQLPENRLPVPVIQPIPARGILGDGTTFFGSGSFDPDGEPVRWLWSLGDGAEASGAIIDHLYTAAGLYPVELTVYDNRGEAASITFSYSVLAEQRPPSGCGCGG
jgi:hypothetical protein